MCALHGLNLTLSSATILTMWDGGLLKHDTLQCLHTAYKLLKQYHIQEWADLWRVVTRLRYKVVKCPVE